MSNISDDSAANSILDVLAVAERLKTELRHSWLSNGRRESVAEHTWLMCLMALLCHGRLGEPVRLDRLLAMIIVHDLAEAEVGDIPYFETGHRKDTKAARERAAFDRIAQMLPSPDGAMIRDLWDEFEHGHSPEARLARALDHLEVQVQHNLADIATWEPIEYDLVYTKNGRPVRSRRVSTHPVRSHSVASRSKDASCLHRCRCGSPPSRGWLDKTWLARRPLEQS
jgi:putative hydrolase of HD superfamily